MPCSIMFYFDAQLDKLIRVIGQPLEKSKISNIFSTLGVFPPITPAMFENFDPPGLRAIMKKGASHFSPASFRFFCKGTFPGQGGAFLLVSATTSLLKEMHSRLHQGLSKVVEGHWNYYFQGRGGLIALCPSI